MYILKYMHSIIKGNYPTPPRSDTYSSNKCIMEKTAAGYLNKEILCKLYRCQGRKRTVKIICDIVFLVLVSFTKD